MKTFFDAMYRSYMVRNAAKDLFRFFRDNVGRIEFDRNYWLRRVGLSTYRPVRRVFGGLGVFTLGIAAGGTAALLLAPKRGRELRAEVKDRAVSMMNRANAAIDEAAQARA